MATIITVTEKSFVRVSKHSNGFYVQFVFNGGENAGQIFIYQTEKAALKKANQLKANY